MKFALAFAFVTISIAVVSAGTCYDEDGKCAKDECCIEVGNRLSSIWGVCLKLKQPGETCRVHQETSLMKLHVYINSCPCTDGMTCLDKDGKKEKVIGTCHRLIEE